MEPEIAEEALRKRDQHLFMLSAELVVFHLFNVEASEQERRKMANALLHHRPHWVPGDFLIDPVILKVL